MSSLSNPAAMSNASGPQCPTQAPVWQRLREVALAYPERLAVASLQQPANLYCMNTELKSEEHLRWTYGQLSRAADILALRLQKSGVRLGSPIATFLSNGVEFILAFWASHKLGCPFVPLSPRALLNANEVTSMLQIAEVRTVLVQDSESAAKLDALDLENAFVTTKICLSDKLPNASWLPMARMMELSRDAGESSNTLECKHEASEVVSILFTSGTTSQPKGVPHTNTTLNVFCENLSLGGTSPDSIFCSVLPNNHAMGYFYTLHFMMHGGAIIYPSATFDAQALITALEQQKATHTALVPTALYAVRECLEARGSPLRSHLVDVCLSGSSVTPDNMRQVIRDLGSQAVSTGFGMTEGSPIWSAPQREPEVLIAGELTIAGPPAPGACISICEEETRTPVARGVRGQVHQSGPGLVGGYLGGVDHDKFYVDEDGRTWFSTGDQGLMLPDGRVCITGRYKDMIIRGGENIAPASIETVVNKHCGVEAQVVGGPDPIAGEVPIVVLHDWKDTSASLIQATVLKHLGPMFVPDEVVTLQQLGLTEYPKTVSGKVQKGRLTELVRALRNEKSNETGKEQSRDHIYDAVVRAYHKATGIPIESLNLSIPAANFADSISTMRVRDSLRKSIGYTLSIGEMMEYPNIAAQIGALQRRESSSLETVRTAVKSSGPPSEADMSITFGDTEQAESMKQIISKIVHEQGFSWSEDVADVIPSYDYMEILQEAGIVDTWNFAIAVVTKSSTAQELRLAVQKALSNNPILASFYITDGSKNPCYVTLKPTSRLWEKCVHYHGAVATIADVQGLAMQYPHQDHSRRPGPLFHALIMDVEETTSAAMVFYVHHIVQDVSSTRLFCEDVEQALTHPLESLTPHMDYRIWADAYQALRMSPAATSSVSYHVNRLSSLHLHQKAFYPPAPLPRKAVTEVPDGLDFGFDAPGLLDLKGRHPELIAVVILKAAMALVNINRTGYSHALFHNFEAARTTIPFVPASLAQRSPEVYEVADVNGPVMQGVFNLVPVPRDETAIMLLKRMQEEQLALTKHASAPLRRIVEALNAQGHGAGDLMIEVQRTQFLTWIPGFLGDYERIQIAHIAIRAVLGLVIVAGIGGPAATTYMLSFRWDEANYSREKTMEYAVDLEAAVKWLTEQGNWDRPVGTFLQELATSKSTANGTT